MAEPSLPAQEKGKSFVRELAKAHEKTQSSAITLTGGPAAPGVPSLPRAPCRTQERKEYLSYSHLLTMPRKSMESACGVSPFCTTNVWQSGQFYLQQGQEHQGGLSHQKDHGDPRKEQKGQGQIGGNPFDLCPLILFGVYSIAQSPNSSWILVCARGIAQLPPLMDEVLCM